jgi:integrase
VPSIRSGTTGTSGRQCQRSLVARGVPPSRSRPDTSCGLLPIEEYRRAFDKGCAEVGIEGLVPHGLRHTTASLAISAGANVKVVQRMLGHATAAMTLDLYGHLLDDDLLGVAEALGKAIDSVAVSLRYPEPDLKKTEPVSAAS